MTLTPQQKLIVGTAAATAAAGAALLLFTKTPAQKKLVWDLLSIGAVGTAVSIPVGLYLVPKLGGTARWGWVPAVALTGLSWYVKHKMLPHAKPSVTAPGVVQGVF